MKKYGSIILGSFLGFIIFGIVGYSVAANINSSSIDFDNTHTGFSSTKLNGALDELYTLIEEVETLKASSPSNKVYTNGEIVYFNPVTNRGCSSSEYSTSNNSATGTKTGCMRWFAYLDSAGSTTVKLLLDHNTTATKAWYSSSTYKTLVDSNIYPELVALVKTSGWQVKPWLIDAQDVATITGISWASTGSDVSFQNGSTYWWLNDRTRSCTSYGCQIADSSNYGYWTSTNKGTSGSYVWLVNLIAYLHYDGATTTDYGVRPVITVYKSNL